MKNVQIISDSDNCTYSVYAVSDEWFALVFPGDRDIEFNEDLFERMDEDCCAKFDAEFWQCPVEKSKTNGIHGTLFYGFRELKQEYYPNKRFYDNASGFSASQRRKFGIKR